MASEFLSELFASKVRAEVLERVVPRPHRGFSLTEFSRMLGLPISSLQHECYKLERIGVLRSRREGSSRRYSINPDCPVERELTTLIVRAMGQELALRAALEDMKQLDQAFIAADLPLSHQDLAESTSAIPLVLIGEIPIEDIDAAQARVASLLGVLPGRIEAVYYSPADWQERVDQQSPYAVWLLQGPRTFLTAEET